jgi:DNA-binding PadR family transcriptional regulator
MSNESFENAILELRRGVIVLAVLSKLGEEQYGYSLINGLKEQGFEIDQGTL